MPSSFINIGDVDVSWHLEILALGLILQETTKATTPRYSRWGKAPSLTYLNVGKDYPWPFTKSEFPTCLNIFWDHPSQFSCHVGCNQRWCDVVPSTALHCYGRRGKTSDCIKWERGSQWLECFMDDLVYFLWLILIFWRSICVRFGQYQVSPKLIFFHYVPIALEAALFLRITIFAPSCTQYNS